MEVENAPSVENQASGKRQKSRFTWKIQNFSKLKEKKLYSDIFVVGSYKWRVLIFPKGNNKVGYLSIYLTVGDSATLPCGWRRYAEFSLAVVNQLHNKYTVKTDTHHEFNPEESDWGFTSFMSLNDLNDPNKGYIENDLLVVEADVVVDNIDYRKETSNVEKQKEEQGDKEDEKRDKAEAHLYTIIKVARDADLKEQIGKDIYFDLVDHDKVRNFRVQKQMPFRVFKEEVAKEFGIPEQFQRLWIWRKRKNCTYRPYRPLRPPEDWITAGSLKKVSRDAHTTELNLFLEVEYGMDLRPIRPPKKNKQDILLFFKLYDPEKEKLRFVGRFFVKRSGKPIEIIKRLNEMAGFGPDEEIELFEELRVEPDVMCERLHNRETFQFNKLEDGDIVCFQKRPLPEMEGRLRFPYVPSFLEYVKNRQAISLLPELQCIEPLKIEFHHATKDEVVILNISLPKQSTVGDVLNEIRTKVELSHPTVELRLLEVFSHEIYKIFLLHEKIENINVQDWTLRAEEIPQEEKDLRPNDRLIRVYHFTKETIQNQVQVRNFGEPFCLVIHEGETLADVKFRIQKKLQVPKGEFLKWKFAFLSLGRPEYLDNSDVVSSSFQYLGLEHSDTTPKKSYAARRVSTIPSVKKPVGLEEHTEEQPVDPQLDDMPLIETEALTTEGPRAISPAPFGSNQQMLRTTQMNNGLPSIIEGVEQREAPSAPAKGEQSHTIAVDDDVVEEIASELKGVRTVADEIWHIMNLELEEAAPHISAKLQMILLKVRDSTAQGLTPTEVAQLQNLMWAAQDLGIDYVGTKFAMDEFEQSTQVYHKMDEMVLKAKNAIEVNEASMVTLKAKIQETFTTEVDAQETIRRAEEEIRKAQATIKETKRLQETYTESLNLKCSEQEQLNEEYKVWERRVARSLADRQVYEQRRSRAERKLNAAHRSWEEIKKTWAELEAVLPAQVYITAGQPTMSGSSIRSPDEEE